MLSSKKRAPSSKLADVRQTWGAFKKRFFRTLAASVGAVGSYGQQIIDDAADTDL
ncbi:hypothetical protein D9M70_144670 [compost metagenome]